MTREEVGRKLGLPEWKIADIERHALTKLRNNRKVRQVYDLSNVIREEISRLKKYRTSKIAK